MERVHDVLQWLRTEVKWKKMIDIINEASERGKKHPPELCVWETEGRRLGSWTNGTALIEKTSNFTLPRKRKSSRGRWTLSVTLDPCMGTASWTFPVHADQVQEEEEEEVEEEEWESALPQGGPLFMMYTPNVKGSSISLVATDP